MQIPYTWLRPYLFSLDPECAHHLTFKWLDALERLNLLKYIVPPTQSLPVKVMGLDFPNPVGLSAGLDKDAAHLNSLHRLGFGFIEVGTVTPHPQFGNPQPRMFRLPEKQALINRLGFNNDGIPNLVRNIHESQFSGILGINIGKNANTPVQRATDDYVRALREVYALASYITVNISSPNTKNLRDLQAGDALDSLLDCLRNTREMLCDEHGFKRPLALKIAPDLDDAQIDAIADRLIHHQFDAVIATNTTLQRTGLDHHKHAQETGGLSGAPLTESSLHVIERLYKRLGQDLPIIGVGGILNGADAQAKLQAGAKLVQIYTGLIYRGPELIGECVQAIQKTMRMAS